MKIVLLLLLVLLVTINVFAQSGNVSIDQKIESLINRKELLSDSTLIIFVKISRDKIKLKRKFVFYFFNQNGVDSITDNLVNNNYPLPPFKNNKFFIQPFFIQHVESMLDPKNTKVFSPLNTIKMFNLLSFILKKTNNAVLLEPKISFIEKPYF